MPTVELLYSTDCPNVRLARANLLQGFVRAKLPPRWSEHVLGDASTPAHVQGHGSPTILVDGRDVVGVPPGGAPSCRVYATAEGVSGAPSAAQITSALVGISTPRPPAGGWRSSVAVLPGIGAALLPKVACPACWPAYSGVLTALGVGFLMDNAWLLPLTALFLVVAVGALAFRARRRRGYGPFAVGVVAAGVVLVSKFQFSNDPGMYVGIGLLVAASLWNTWPRRRRQFCPACVTGA